MSVTNFLPYYSSTMGSKSGPLGTGARAPPAPLPPGGGGPCLSHQGGC
eukprot:COSAG02_NODE_10176_length_2002_cov_1.482396_2_plen_48_part_00